MSGCGSCQPEYGQQDGQRLALQVQRLRRGQRRAVLRVPGEVTAAGACHVRRRPAPKVPELVVDRHDAF